MDWVLPAGFIGHTRTFSLVMWGYLVNRVLPAGFIGHTRTFSLVMCGYLVNRVLSAGLFRHTRRASQTKTVGVPSRRTQAQGAALAAGPTRV